MFTVRVTVDLYLRRHLAFRIYTQLNSVVESLLKLVAMSVRPSVRPSVHPQKVCPISTKFGMQIERGQTVDRVTRFKVKVGQGHGGLKVAKMANNISKYVSSGNACNQTTNGAL